VSKELTRCKGCHAPIQFLPGAGSRLCPFCGYINLVREQRLAVPSLELKTDEVFHKIQKGDLKGALSQAESLLDPQIQGVRLAYYRACVLLRLEQITEAVYAFIDLTGLDAPQPLRADTQASLAAALFAADRQEEALEAIERCLRLVENHPRAMFTKAKILMEMDRLSEAADVLESTIPLLTQRWKTTFPPRPSSMLMLLARIYIRQERPNKAVIPLENLLLQVSAASLPTVARAIKMLGFNYLDTRRNKEEGLTLIRQGALLDPQNQLGLLDSLKSAVEKFNESYADEMKGYSEKRAEIFSEIKDVLRLDDKISFKPDQVRPETALSTLHPEADQRTDVLEKAARRLDINFFDRGTLYPLETFEDFRRWIVAWRARQYIKRLKRDQLEQERIDKLKAVREHNQTRSSFHRQKARVDNQRKSKKRFVIRLILIVLLSTIVMSVVFIAMFGDRYFDHFKGQLVKIECAGGNEHPPCTLHVSTGQAGRARYLDRTANDSFFSRLASSWLDQRVQKNGLLLYPLDFPWGDISAKQYRKCFMKQISKTRFTFTPDCRIQDPKK
jgi:LSD1 subclass zinc finger protein